MIMETGYGLRSFSRLRQVVNKCSVLLFRVIDIPEQVRFIHLKQTWQIIIKFLKDSIHYGLSEESGFILYPVALAVDIKSPHLSAVEHQGKAIIPS